MKFLEYFALALYVVLAIIALLCTAAGGIIVAFGEAAHRTGERVIGKAKDLVISAKVHTAAEALLTGEAAVVGVALQAAEAI
jgi:hypothetical protein